ncbi:MATE efflux family protein [Eubacterium sp. 14-2]|uniref:MATE family efflux transporter n=1 Tax=Eubacterium sp. 14-2 TaxID=1235790 RepID=UPI0003353416|nr:MATE family efflux transporter [Eubacterium sp. 14-2]EOT21686.1 MATE efflux family protein [Eubacterium sp. 14-2]
MKRKSYEIDMCNGPLFSKILLFAIPLMISSILQLLFNAADMVVVGRFAGSTALAAVGANASLINLLTNLFIGFSVGANVLVARFYGAGKEQDISETVHSAVVLSLVSGLGLMVFGMAVAPRILVVMGTPGDVLSQAVLYIRIYFAGMPVILLYNFGSSILRAVGDTRRPLYYLSGAGVINVVLNLIFVIGFHLGVAGVALATVISQVISAGLVFRCLTRMKGGCRVEWQKMRMKKEKVMQIVRIGLPAGLQGTVFSLSNVLIQSSVNSFGSVAMAGNTAAQNIEGFIYMSMNACHQTALSFTSQNFGAGNYRRIGKVLMECLAMVTVVGLVMGWSAYLCGGRLLGIYSSDPKVIEVGLLRLSVICTAYCLCGIMDVMVGELRGLGYAVLPMIVSLLGACGFRILWIFTVFQSHRSLWVLYISYPVSWVLTGAVHMVCYILIRKKLFSLQEGKI